MRLSIGLKLGFWLAILGLMSTALTGYYVYYQGRHLLIESSQEKLLTSTRVQAHRFTDLLASISSDVRLIGALPVVEKMARDHGEGLFASAQKAELAELFTGLMQTHPVYSQIRLIKAADYGKEMVRVDRDQGGIKIVADRDLREKSHFAYVFETLRLPAGTLYTSDINLNLEQGSHEGYGKPTLRIAMPVYAPDGKIFGLVVVNIALQEMFDMIRGDLPDQVNILLTNDQGDYLIHPDAAKTFGFDLGQRFQIQDDAPETAALYATSNDHAVIQTKAALVGKPALAAFVKVPYGSPAEHRFVLLGLYTPIASVLQQTHALGLNVVQMTAAFAFAAMLISLLLARILAKPLNLMEKSISNFAIGKPLAELPVDRDDEIGSLARGFQSMTHKLNQQVVELWASEEQLRAMFQLSPLGMARNAMDGRYMEVNKALLDMLGYTMEELNRLSYWDLTPPEYAEQEALQLEALHRSGRYGPYEKEYVRHDGLRIPIRLNGVLIVGSDGEKYIWSIIEDITQRRESEELIWKQANFDPLTGLPNRRMFHDRLEQELKKSHRSSTRMALMFLDLDHFKEVNDTLGHAMGDVLLKESAERLVHCVRESDTVARLGGDEFTVILSELDDAEAVERVAQNMLRRLSEPYLLGDEMAYVSVSIGVTLYPEDAGDIETLLKNADQAMYAAKRLGRNRCSYFTPSMQEAAQARMRLAVDLRAALAQQQFRVLYQPIVDLATGDVHKAEALLRWEHPTLGLVSPEKFIPLAEETGMIGEIGHWVFRQAANQVQHWRKFREDFQISVNKSPAQFMSEDRVHDTWFDYLRELQLEGNSVVVEITEGLLLDASPAITNKLLGFRDAGMQVAIDDFGTGYSSLAYLKKFDIDYLKIDRAFIRNLAPNSDDMALCEAIIVMAHKLGIQVIAEGIETEAQRDLLAAAGCDYGQGYLFSRPIAAEAFEQLFASTTA
ncbi:PAS domain S-box protein [Novimethylophilus kurashikiensis]|uniref:PAS domain S-box protein n=1 Tax=Novimethylophilus kurashikiensis TaxID=1825523 RepID=A0A2R5FFS8_9PROT|nr:EAL domain-containing protein [Novimethylophilus kurashikiensis]GBG15144.1 PAS domain S-box protein [Novimethylophilus kurashikiensis]